MSPAPAALDLTDAPTACVLCSHNCGLRVDVRDNTIVAVRPDATNPLTKGYSCNKAYRVSHYVKNRQRLTEPLERQPDGTFRPVSWDHAIDAIGGRLRALTDAHGPDALAVLGLGGQANHLGVVPGLALAVGWGTRWWFNALAQEKTQRALVDRWMLDAPSDAMLVGDPDRADYAIIMGSNPAISQRGPEPSHMLAAFRKDPNRTLVIVDPRKTETARKADLHVALAPGSDAWLLMGMAAVIVRERLYDADFVTRRTTGFAAVVRALRAVDVAEMARRCHIEVETIRTLARGLAGAERGTIEMDLGVEQSRFNTLTAYLLRLNLALTGNLGRPGGAIFVSSFVPRMPRLRQTPPTAPVSGIEGVALMAPLPMFSPNLFAEEVLRDHPDRIRAAIIDGTNPMLTYADTTRVKAALDRLELKVVIDIAMTETAAEADFVLPALAGYEKWAMSAFPKAFPSLGAQLRPPVIAGPPKALHEAEIYHRLGRAAGLTRRAPWLVRQAARLARRPLGTAVYLALALPLALVYARRLRRALPMALSWVHETVGQRLAAPQLASVWLTCIGVAVTRRADVERLRPEARDMRLPTTLGEHLFDLVMKHPHGVELGHVDADRILEDHLGWSDGRVRLAPEVMMDEIARALATDDTPDPERPFILNGGMRTHWTANANMRDPAWRKGRGPHCTLRMHPDDAAGLGLKKGQPAHVSTHRGRVTLPVALDKHVRPGHVHIPNGFGTRYPDPETGALRTAGVNINVLTDDQDRDPFTGCPHHKLVRCRIEPALDAA